MLHWLTNGKVGEKEQTRAGGGGTVVLVLQIGKLEPGWWWWWWCSQVHYVRGVDIRLGDSDEDGELVVRTDGGGKTGQRGSGIPGVLLRENGEQRSDDWEKLAAVNLYHEQWVRLSLTLLHTIWDYSDQSKGQDK